MHSESGFLEKSEPNQKDSEISNSNDDSQDVTECSSSKKKTKKTVAQKCREYRERKKKKLSATEIEEMRLLDRQKSKKYRQKKSNNCTESDLEEERKKNIQKCQAYRQREKLILENPQNFSEEEVKKITDRRLQERIKNYAYKKARRERIKLGRDPLEEARSFEEVTIKEEPMDKTVEQEVDHDHDLRNQESTSFVSVNESDDSIAQIPLSRLKKSKSRRRQLSLNSNGVTEVVEEPKTNKNFREPRLDLKDSLCINSESKIQLVPLTEIKMKNMVIFGIKNFKCIFQNLKPDDRNEGVSVIDNSQDESNRTENSDLPNLEKILISTDKALGEICSSIVKISDEEKIIFASMYITPQNNIIDIKKFLKYSLLPYINTGSDSVGNNYYNCPMILTSDFRCNFSETRSKQIIEFLQDELELVMVNNPHVTMARDSSCENAYCIDAVFARFPNLTQSDIYVSYFTNSKVIQTSTIKAEEIYT